MFAYFHQLVRPLVIVLSGATAPPNAQETALPTAAEIRRAWTHRSETMGPYGLQAELTEQVAVKGRLISNDPAETRRIGTETICVTAQKTIAIQKDGAKVRTAIVGEAIDSDNGEVYAHQRHACFDGQLYKMFGKRDEWTIGLGGFGTGETDIALGYKSVAFQAIEWWFDPIRLWKRLPDENIQISNTDLKLPSGEGLKLRVVEQGRIISAIIVSKSRPYLPLECVLYSKSGKEYIRCTFIHSNDAKVPAHLVSWEATYLQPDESIGRKLKGTVVDFSNDNRFDSEELNLRFPVGTHICEYLKEGRRSWMQTSPTEMKPMKDSDYGKQPEGSRKPAS